MQQKFTMTSKFIWVFLCISTSICAQQSLPTDMEKINWPPAYEPSKSKFFVHNEIEVDAPPQVVWEILTAAESWPDWYKGAQNVVVRPVSKGVLKENSVFTWKTMGLDFESTIKEFVPYSRLSWESQKKSIQGYHAWLIVPTAQGCKVITDESQNGWLTFFEKIFQPNKMRKLHDVWLLEIKKKAEAQVKQ